ncbi:MAG: hypothetical protein U0359_10155 [Byssovorax sp.]
MARVLWWSWGSIRKAFGAGAASIVLHGALLGPALLVCASRPSAASEPVEAADRWAGQTAALQGERVYDVNIEPGGGQSKPSLPGGPGADLAPSPPSPPSPPDAPASPPPEPPRAPAPSAPPAVTSAPVAPSSTASAARPSAKKSKSKPRKPKPASSASEGPSAPGGEKNAAGDPGGGAAGESGGSFGAEGPGGVRDLGRAFTRAIPPAGQADPIWSSLPLGDAGTIEIMLTIDEGGHIKGSVPLTESPPRHLLRLIERTMPLLEAGTFALQRGTVSAGTEVLRVHVSLHEGEPSAGGDATGLSFAFSRGKGTATFTQSSGRRVEVLVEVRKVTAAKVDAKGDEGKPPG